MDLLDSLTTLFGCNYLSDLRGLRLSEPQADAFRSFFDSQYTLEDYAKAAAYIADSVVAVASVEEAKKIMLRHWNPECKI